MAMAAILVIGSSLQPLMAMNSQAKRAFSVISSTTKFNAKRTKLLLARSSLQQQEQEEKEEEEDDDNKNNNKGLSFQEDLGLLWKLGAGSVGGAAVIKYGSVIFPQITRPNIGEALIMISTPVIVSVLLLIKQSYVERQNKD